MIKLLLGATSAFALLPATPALAQHSGHGGMTMPTPAQPAITEPAPVDHSQMDHGAAPDAVDHAAMGHGPDGSHGAMRGAYGPYGSGREASGTAWQPDSSEHDGIHVVIGDWTLMLHGNANVIYNKQGGRRGDDKFYLAGHLIAAARRPLGNGTLQFRTILSPDPLMGKRGYPLLLQSGETADGETRLIDRQHPHDLIRRIVGQLQRSTCPKRTACSSMAACRRTRVRAAGLSASPRCLRKSGSADQPPLAGFDPHQLRCGDRRPGA